MSFIYYHHVDVARRGGDLKLELIGEPVSGDFEPPATCVAISSICTLVYLTGSALD